jgi:hypothetical protein
VRICAAAGVMGIRTTEVVMAQAPTQARERNFFKNNGDISVLSLKFKLDKCFI